MSGSLAGPLMQYRLSPFFFLDSVTFYVSFAPWRYAPILHHKHHIATGTRPAVRMSVDRRTAITPSEALAAGAATLPPEPADAPLATTFEDVGGVEVPAVELVHDPSASGASLPTLVGDDEQQVTKEKHDASFELTKIPAEDLIHTETSKRRPLSFARLVLVAAIVTCTMVMSAGGNQSLNIALPTIHTDLHMRETDLQWLSSAYALTSACFLLLSGRMADVHGRKTVFVCGLTWYAIWFLIGGFMKNGVGLIITRALAGSGASMR